MALKNYFLSSHCFWYWVTIALDLATVTLGSTVSGNFFQLVYVRNILGIVLVLVLPGYALIKLFFPKKDLNTIEEILLSIGMSIALASITALLLSYTPWGVTRIPIIFSLFTLTASFATAAIIRDYLVQVRIISEK